MSTLVLELKIRSTQMIQIKSLVGPKHNGIAIIYLRGGGIGDLLHNIPHENCTQTKLLGYYKFNVSGFYHR